MKGGLELGLRQGLSVWATFDKWADIHQWIT